MLKYLSIVVVASVMAGCASSTHPDNYSQLSAARDAIAQARAQKAEACAPKLLAKAESRLLWAAHEIDEQQHDNRGAEAELAELIAQAEGFARQAKAAAINRCKDQTTVILLPDEDGKVGSISLQAGGAAQTIDKAFHASSVRGDKSQPEAVKAMSEADVNRQFAGLIKAQPLKPAHFTLYFIAGSSELTPASKAVIPQVLQAAKLRFPAEVNVVGHTDSTGSEHVNMRISAKRASVVEQLLKDSAVPPKSIYLRFFGEKDPLVPTADNVAEPRNRRVEVMVL